MKKRLQFLLLALCSSLITAAQAQSDPAAERARIAQERSSADQRLREQEQACAGRFAVTACVEQARRAHRDAVAPLRQQEFLLDDDVRRQRAQQRRFELELKAAQPKSDVVLPGTTTTTPPDDSAAAVKKAQPSVRQSPPTPSIEAERQQAQKQAAAQREAEKRVKAQQEKLALAERRKAELEKRNAAKAASGKPLPAPLKAPAASGP